MLAEEQNGVGADAYMQADAEGWPSVGDLVFEGFCIYDLNSSLRLLGRFPARLSLRGQRKSVHLPSAQRGLLKQLVTGVRYLRHQTGHWKSMVGDEPRSSCRQFGRHVGGRTSAGGRVLKSGRRFFACQ